MDGSSSQKINKETLALKDTQDQWTIYKYMYVYTHTHTHTHTHIHIHKYGNCIHIFSSVHGTFYRIDHMLCHQTSLSKFKKIEIISSTISDHSTVRLEINCRKKLEKKNMNM